MNASIEKGTLAAEVDDLKANVLAFTVIIRRNHYNVVPPGLLLESSSDIRVGLGHFVLERAVEKNERRDRVPV
jgi:hypothetical protein